MKNTFQKIIVMIPIICIMFGCAIQDNTDTRAYDETQTATAQTEQISEAQSRKTVVTVFNRPDYDASKGYSVALEVGTYTKAQLGELGIPRESISSIQVTPGYGVILYARDNFHGDLDGTEAVQILKSYPHLDWDMPYGAYFSNKAISLKVFKFTEESQYKWSKLDTGLWVNNIIALSVQNKMRYAISDTSLLAQHIPEIVLGEIRLQSNNRYKLEKVSTNNAIIKPRLMVNGFRSIFTINESNNQVSRIDLNNKTFYNNVLGYPVKDIVIDYGRKKLFALTTDGHKIHVYNINNEASPSHILTYTMTTGPGAHMLKKALLNVHDAGYPILCWNLGVMRTVPTTQLYSPFKQGTLIEMVGKPSYRFVEYDVTKNDVNGRTDVTLGSFNQNLRSAMVTYIYGNVNGSYELIYKREKSHLADASKVIGIEMDHEGLLWRLESDLSVYKGYK